MIEIPLRNRQKKIIAYSLVDDEDFEWLNKYKWYKCIGYAIRKTSRTLDKNGKQKTIRMATEIMKKYRLYEITKQIDHINQNKLDNRKYNLRMATHSQNMLNRKSFAGSISKYKGVSLIKNTYRKKRWIAYLQINYKSVNLGYFKTELEAARAYDESALKFHGEFAQLNLGNGDVRTD